MKFNHFLFTSPLIPVHPDIKLILYDLVVLSVSVFGYPFTDSNNMQQRVLNILVYYSCERQRMTQHISMRFF